VKVTSKLALAAGTAWILASAAPAAGHRIAADLLVAPGATSSGANVALGRRMAAADGWTGQQWSCLDWLWTRESGWRLVWNTAGSGAYGIPQALPAGKMASAGADWMTSAATEIRWGLGYIHAEYGTPCNAWRHEEAAGSY